MSFLLVALFILMVAYTFAFPQDLDMENLIKTVILILIITVIVNRDIIFSFIVRAVL